MMFRLAITILTLFFAQAVAKHHDEPVLHWASAGGGWRAMAANMGYASAFYQAGLLSKDSSGFASISATSGGAWFMMQFFYSDPFLSKVLVDDADMVYDFVVDWMTAYQDAYRDLDPFDPRCAPLLGVEAVPGLETLPQFCILFGPYDFDWALFIQEMLDAAATDYGDPGLVDRPASHENRVDALKDTELYIQMGLASSSSSDGETAYLGPTSDPSSTYSVLLPMQYAVKNDRTFFNYGVEDEDLPFVAMTAATPDTWELMDWNEFHLFPPPVDADVLTTLEDPTTGDTDFREPFGGKVPNIAQISAATSSAVAGLDPTNPSFYGQIVSTFVFAVENTPGLPDEQKEAVLGIVDAAFSYIYEAPIFEGLSVCSQWPNDCGAMDSRLIDGANVDGPTLAQSIGQYQTIDNGDLSKPFKVIVTNHNIYSNTNVRFLEYFNTMTNQGIDPGDFNWELSVTPGFPVALNPSRSKQIFAEPLDDESMLSAFVEIPGTNLTTAVYEATTIDNPAFQVKAGQKVEILLLQINSNIPTDIFGPAIEGFIDPLAELAQTIAGSGELVARIKDFVGTDDDDKPTPPSRPKGKGKGKGMRRRKHMRSKNKSKGSKSKNKGSKSKQSKGSKSVRRKKKPKIGRKMEHRGLRV